jgi:hypothetical protein
METPNPPASSEELASLDPLERRFMLFWSMLFALPRFVAARVAAVLVLIMTDIDLCF